MNSASWIEPDATIHVHDLPQLWQRPSGEDLLRALSILAVAPPSFDIVRATAEEERPSVDESGVPAYLTSIVASQLVWIQDDEIREQIWDAASLRLSERSGRTAMPAMTRTFQITDDLTVALHEPSLTGDNLGLKTWASSLLLSKQLPVLRKHLPVRTEKLLELGAGTGLVGISAACLWPVLVVLTDLPEIVPNLQRNLQLNADQVDRMGSSVQARTLDWSSESDSPTTPDDKFKIIIAADPIYSPSHPMILVDAIKRWLIYSEDARVIIELPLRTHYIEERAQLRALLGAAGLDLVVEGTEAGLDDWLDEDGQPARVECEWSIWQPGRV